MPSAYRSLLICEKKTAGLQSSSVHEAVVFMSLCGTKFITTCRVRWMFRLCEGSCCTRAQRFKCTPGNDPFLQLLLLSCRLWTSFFLSGVNPSCCKFPAVFDVIVLHMNQKAATKTDNLVRRGVPYRSRFPSMFYWFNPFTVSIDSNGGNKRVSVSFLHRAKQSVRTRKA